ncbi:MarR family transcriptional regulator [Lentibacillus sp. N15]|uniref:MarR family winged helix-turn-helix transcriptional regulator n=1 Tax=Lentibacillus songyuanensis TaxID=3136161 RepID=UPI0031BA26DF
MDKDSLKNIEHEVTVFVRRIVLSDKQHRRLERSAYVILRQLSIQGPAGVKSLAENLHLDISTISRQAAALEKRNYVEKIPNPEDGRSYFYRITEPGVHELDENKQRRYQKLEAALSDWSDEEKRTFADLLKKYNQTVEKI